MLGLFVALTVFFASISVFEYLTLRQMEQGRTQTYTNASESFNVWNENAIPTSFSLGDGYSFKVSNTGPPPLPNSMETATRVTIEVSYRGVAAQNVSFLWSGTWSAYELPSPIDATALNGMVSFHWAKTSDNSSLVLTIATS